MSPRERVFMIAAGDRECALAVAASMTARLCEGFPPGFAAALRGDLPEKTLAAAGRALLQREDRGDRAAREEDAEGLRQLAEVCRLHRITWQEIDRVGPAPRVDARRVN